MPRQQRFPALPRCSSTRVRWATTWSRWSGWRKGRRGHEAGGIVGDQRRRRLLAAAVAVPRRPQQGDRTARRRFGVAVGQSAAVGVRHQLRGHVGGSDPGRRRGQRTVCGRIQRTDRRARHRRGGCPRFAFRRACGTADSADRAAGADQHRDGRHHRVGPSTGRCATAKFPPSWCGSGSLRWVLAPSSRTLTSRCSRPRSIGRRWSPTISKGFSVDPPRHSGSGWPTTSACSRISKGERRCRIRSHRAISSR